MSSTLDIGLPTIAPMGFGGMRLKQTIKVYSYLEDRNAQPVEPEKPPAQVEWGGASNFNFGEAEDFSVGPSIEAKRDGDDTDGPDQNTSQVFKFVEVARVEETREIEIEGTDGGTITNKIIKEIVFQGPQQGGYDTYYHYVMNNPTE